MDGQQDGAGWVVRTGERPGTAGRLTEDHIVVLPDAVVVLDGVSTVTGDEPLGGWYARTLGERLADGLGGGAAADLRVVLSGAIRAVAAEHRLLPGRSPAATVAVLRRSGDRLDALVLGDSPVVAFGRDGTVHELRDDRLADLVAPRPQLAEYRDRLAAGSGYDQRHRELMRELREFQYTVINREGGYWIAEAEPEAGLRARTASWPLAELTDVVLATDGVSSLVDDYRLADWRTLVEDCRRSGPQWLVDAVHEAEAGDQGAVKWPRGKVHDDKALAHVTLDAPSGQPA
ncbi:protein phosphatase 2C domain-containing protein [Kitasatospora sp. NPDC101801]|uniref:protein phosphatase 2C domain-containing protein n=1 Tax=Kitasatospora sp. NPDC101801 TaxID=3364103 RepID=UPI003813FE5A